MFLQTSVQPVPASVVPGFSVILNTSITASEDAPLLLLMQIFNASTVKVHEAMINNIPVIAGQPKSVPFVWSVPADLPEGTYSVSLGIFGANWTTMYSWLAGVATFKVKADAQIPSFVSTAQVDPSRIAPGGSLRADVSVTSSVDANALTEVSLVQPDGVKILPRSFSDAFVAGQPRHLIADWVVPTDAPLGTYQVTVGVYKPDRTVAYHLNPSAAQFKVVSDPGQAPALIKVRVRTDNTPITGQPHPEFEIYSISDEPINLKDIKIRYYFKIDIETALAIGFWSTLSKDKVTTSFVKMPVPSDRADYYLEIGFTEAAGALQPGAKVGVYTWFNRSPWGAPFDQTNDYSYTGSGEFIDSLTTTGYFAGVLNWGVEPQLSDVPPFPASITAVPADTSITVTWQPVAGATGYDVQADGAEITDLTDASYVDLHLNPGTLHTYKVRTRKDGEVSIWSSPLTLKTTGEQRLPPPVNVRARPTESSITVTWSALQESITGYDIEVDGTVMSVGTATSHVHGGLTPGVRHEYRVRAKDNGTLGSWSSRIRANTIRVPTGTFDVSFSVDTSAERASISPYIYGTNSDFTGTERCTARRLGGNRMSGYNWENNASNGGSDWHHANDNYLPWRHGIPDSESNTPGIAVTVFHERSLSKGAYSLVTLQTAGYVAKDKNGIVSEGEVAPSPRWVAVRASKGAPFSLAPDLNDNAVFMDEFVHFLVNRFGDASTATGIKGYAIDNEAGLWSSTHARMHPARTSSAEVLNKSIDLARAVKLVDPHAQIFGPASYGFSEFYDMQGSTDWASVKGNYDWYIDYYLDKVRIASGFEGKRLLDVLDLHGYSEIKIDGQLIAHTSDDNVAANEARVQAPRSLWDPSYWEGSWISEFFSSFLPLIPRVQRSIDTHNKETKLSFSEYNYGGEGHITGGIATADALGIFGKFGVHLATFWKLDNQIAEAPYVSAAFKLFNNYDGSASRYGDTSVKAETSDIDNSSVYSSVYRDSDDSLHLIVMNKNSNYDMNAILHLAGGTSYTSARVWAFDGNSAEITERQAVTGIANNSFTYTIPKLTVCHIVLASGAT
jgi:hypothetical protein